MRREACRRTKDNRIGRCIHRDVDVDVHHRRRSNSTQLIARHDRKAYWFGSNSHDTVSVSPGLYCAVATGPVMNTFGGELRLNRLLSRQYVLR